MRRYLFASLIIIFLSMSSALSAARALTLTEGTNFSVDISADGRTIVMDLLGTLWLLPVEGGPAIPRTDPGEIEARLPKFSPDGTSIAFQGFHNGYWHIWTIPAAQGDATQHTFGPHDDREPDWHPDGTRITFSSDRSDKDDIWDVTLAAMPENNTLQQITDETAINASPAWSPDGKRLAYVRGGRGASTLVLLDDQPDAIAEIELPGTLHAPSWHPKGTSLTVVQIHDETATLNLVEVESSAVLDMNRPGEDVFPFHTPWIDDSRFLYTADGAIKKLNIATFTADAVPFEAEINLNRTPYNKKQHDFSARARQVKGILGPVANPDGSRIAFTALGDLWLQDEAGTLTQLTDEASMALDPDWSPDGSTLAYVSDREGVMDIWLRNMQSGAERKLTSLSTGAVMPVFSPDGQRIAFHQSTGNNGLGPMIPAMVDLTTGTVTSLTGIVWGAGRPAWTEDGQHVTFLAQQSKTTRLRDAPNQVMIINPATKDVTWVSAPDGQSFPMRHRNGPHWDGKKIYYIRGADLWRATWDGTTQTLNQEERLNDGTGFISSVALSRDGSTLTYLNHDRLMRMDVESGATTDITPDMTWTPKESAQLYVIHAGRVFTGTSDTYQTNMDIYIESNRIADIRPHTEHPLDVDVIDASDQTILPGLIDIHVHQHAGLGERQGRIWLGFGITSVREPGVDPYDALERKESWGSGRRLGPRQFYSGGQLDGPRSFYAFSHPTNTPQDIDREMERAARLDYDFIKTYTRLSEEDRDVVIGKAHALGIPVTAHDYYPAALFGGDGVEHLRGTSRRGFSPKLSEMNRAYGDVVQILGESGMTVTPTLVARGGFAFLAKNNPQLLSSPQYQTLFTESELRMMEGMAFGMARNMTTITQRLQNHFDEVSALKEAGANITTGTDSPIIPYGLALHAEIQLLANTDLTPADTLRGATINAARAIGVDTDLGTLEVGKLADMIIVDGDPLTDMADLMNIQQVIINGVTHPIATILANEAQPYTLED